MFGVRVAGQHRQRGLDLTPGLTEAAHPRHRSREVHPTSADPRSRTRTATTHRTRPCGVTQLEGVATRSSGTPDPAVPTLHSTPNRHHFRPAQDPTRSQSTLGAEPGSPTPDSGQPSWTGSPTTDTSSRPAPPATASPTPEQNERPATHEPAQQPNPEHRVGPKQAVTVGPIQVDIRNHTRSVTRTAISTGRWDLRPTSHVCPWDSRPSP